MIRHFSSGLADLDAALFGPEVPGGSLVEIQGEPDSGKTALALWFLRTYQQKPGGWGSFVHTEACPNLANLRWAGIDLGRLLIGRQAPFVSALELARDLVLEGSSVVVIDSLAAIFGPEEKAGLAGQLQLGLFRLKEAVVEKKSLVVMTNQDRHLGRARYSAGSCPALYRMTDVRIHLKAGVGLYDADVQVGQRVHFKLIKNGPNSDNWGRQGRFNCRWPGGLTNLRT